MKLVGAKVLCLSPYSPDLTQSSYGGHNSNFFYGVSQLQQKWLINSSPLHLDLINPQHLKTGLLIAVIVPHNTGSAVKCLLIDMTICLLKRSEVLLHLAIEIAVMQNETYLRRLRVKSISPSATGLILCGMNWLPASKDSSWEFHRAVWECWKLPLDRPLWCLQERDSDLTVHRQFHRFDAPSNRFFLRLAFHDIDKKPVHLYDLPPELEITVFLVPDNVGTHIRREFTILIAKTRLPKKWSASELTWGEIKLMLPVWWLAFACASIAALRQSPRILEPDCWRTWKRRIQRAILIIETRAVPTLM